MKKKEIKYITSYYHKNSFDNLGVEYEVETWRGMKALTVLIQDSYDVQHDYIHSVIIQNNKIYVIPDILKGRND